MSYRVETASSGRAGCRATECKKNGIKIEKDELRLGSWVAFEDKGSWHWKHWGCVTGKQLQNLRSNLEDPERPGTYRWDFLDGYDGDDKSSLTRSPDLQAKVRRVITQGYIDAEDWNGDPEMNKLGEIGLFTKETKRKMTKDKKDRTQQNNELQNPVAAQSGQSASKLDVKFEAAQAELDEKAPRKKKVEPKKRAHVKDESDEDASEVKPAKKKRATKAKKEESDAEAEIKPTPARKPRAMKAVKKEEDGEMVEHDEETKMAPTRKSQVKKAVKKEDDVKKEEGVKKEDVKVGESEEEDVEPPKAKRSRPKKGIKKEEYVEMVKDEPDFDAPTMLSAPKRAPRGKKAVKNEPVDEQSGFSPPIEEKKPTKRGRKKAVKEESTHDVSMASGVEPSSSGLMERNTNISTTRVKNNPSNDIKGEVDEDSEVIRGAKDEVSQKSAVASVGSFDGGVKGEDSRNIALPADDKTFLPEFKDGDLLRSFKQAYEAGEVDDNGDKGWEQFLEQVRAEVALSQPKGKNGRKKDSAESASSSRRSKRTTSKT